jgi:hypothetical protein
MSIAQGKNREMSLLKIIAYLRHITTMCLKTYGHCWDTYLNKPNRKIRYFVGIHFI